MGIWDDLLSEEDRQVIAGRSPRKQFGFGERPALLVIDNYLGRSAKTARSRSSSTNIRVPAVPTLGRPYAIPKSSCPGRGKQGSRSFIAGTSTAPSTVFPGRRTQLSDSAS